MPGGRPRVKTQVDSVKSVTKVLDILEHLGSTKGAVSVSELARMTGLNVSTAFRLLQTLMARGYVEQQASDRGYLLGPRIFQMGSVYLQGSDLAAIARPHLEALRDDVGETAYLVIFSQGEIVQLCKADGKQAVSASVRSIMSEPPDASGTRGRASAASADETSCRSKRASPPSSSSTIASAAGRKSRVSTRTRMRERIRPARLWT